jgi:uncharacterized protein (DUF427 family)
MNRSSVELGQESVWDCPRPPRLEGSDRHIKVVFGGVTLAYTGRAKRVPDIVGPSERDPATWGW